MCETHRRSVRALLCALAVCLCACSSSEPTPPVATAPDTTGSAGARSAAVSASAGAPAASPGATNVAGSAPVSTAPPAAGSGAAVAPPPVPVERAAAFDAGKDPNRNKVTAADLCTRLVAINCAGEAFCCDTPTRTVDACKTALLQTCTSELMIDRIAMNPITGFDAGAAEKAYTELESKAAACDPTVAAWGASSDGLLGILKGSVAAGASCMPAQALPDAVTLAAALVSCADSRTNACLFENPLGAWTCSPKVAEGGTCNSDNNCSDGFYCNLPSLSLTGQCAARKAVGMNCTGPTQCVSLFCKSGKCVEADQRAAYCLAE
ncbi:MAG: Dickkopf N-terminal cysteine-rich domain-containing protein [Polyangiales bacterium]